MISSNILKYKACVMKSQKGREQANFYSTYKLMTLEFNDKQMRILWPSFQVKPATESLGAYLLDQVVGNFTTPGNTTI